MSNLQEGNDRPLVLEYLSEPMDNCAEKLRRLRQQFVVFHSMRCDSEFLTGDWYSGDHSVLDEMRRAIVHEAAA